MRCLGPVAVGVLLLGCGADEANADADASCDVGDLSAELERIVLESNSCTGIRDCEASPMPLLSCYREGRQSCEVVGVEGRERLERLRRLEHKAGTCMPTELLLECDQPYAESCEVAELACEQGRCVAR